MGHQKQQLVFRFKYSGDHIRSVTATEELVRRETFPQRYAHWMVVILGILASYGWWKLW